MVKYPIGTAVPVSVTAMFSINDRTYHNGLSCTMDFEELHVSRGVATLIVCLTFSVGIENVVRLFHSIRQRSMSYLHAKFDRCSTAVYATVSMHATAPYMPPPSLDI